MTRYVSVACDGLSTTGVSIMDRGAYPLAVFVPSEVRGDHFHPLCRSTTSDSGRS
jgi:hypothetical protein